ncbi:TonB-dependent receptor [Mucilaginibacter gynuensis]|uniref:TonB-dependent receptor n=1 Tax=Mucilaginibacter gynuensis TaxID=1302236 RepID=A0ABP8G6Y7_9SPHI
MRKKITLFIFLLLAGFSAAFAQDLTVKGKVVDQNAQPLPGVSVVVKGSPSGTQTDVNGNYSITAPSSGTLVFSFIGYANQEVRIGGQSTININMSDDVKKLEEVVVIGYGTQKKSVVTGAISSVKSKDFQDQQVVNITDVLKGRTSGVVATQSSGSPGSTATIRVRGITSINNSEPLYVIDGVIGLNGGLENINPNDIESVEVLKDASAAIYGSRASAGVILVTTKKGKLGASSISYNGYIGIQNVVKKIDMANASEYATLRNQALTNDGVATTDPRYFDGHDAFHPTPANAGVGTNWQDQIFGDNAKIQSHSLSVQGGNDKSNYYTSFGYLNQQGIIFPEISNYKRYNFTVNSSTKVKWLTVGENFQYAYTRSQGGVNTNSEFGGPLSSALNLDPLTPVVVTGDIPNVPDYQNNLNFLIRDPQGRPYGLSQLVRNELTNPVAFVQTQLGNYGWSHNALGNAFAEISPIAGLKIRTQIGGKQSFYGSQSFSPLYFLNTLVNNKNNPNAYRATNRNVTWNWDNTASYTRSIGDHNFSVLVGTSAQSQSAVGVGAQYNNLPITSYQQLSFNFDLPNAQRIANSNEDQPYTVSSLFARATYDYKEKYLFTGIVRRDGSSRFGSNNVYGVFPSVSVGWVVNKENFFPQDIFLNSLKIRASYGAVGNEQSLGPFYYTSVVVGGANYVFGQDQLVIGNSPKAPANADLKWESVRTSDIGFDAVLFNSLNLSVDLYRKLTKGMIQNVDLPAYAGFNEAYRANVGDLENKGIEVELGYNRKFGEVNMSFSGNLSYNKNKVTYLGLTKFMDQGNFQATNYALYRTQVGQPVTSFYGFRELGTFKSQAEIDAYTFNGTKIQPDAKPGDFKWQDTNGDGKIGEDDRQFLGSQLPSWTYGFNVGGTYKGFDLKIFGQGVWGNMLYQGYRRLDIGDANYQRSALNAWTPQNSNSNYPRLSVADPNHNFSYPSNFNLQSGAYFRIKTAQIGYSLPATVLRKLDVNRLRVYVSSNNLATITKYDGFDPEIQGGIDRSIYPQSRSFLLGLDITL